MKKGKQPLLYVLSSVASWAVDTGGFFVLSLLFGSALGTYSEAVCNIAARVISSFFNFNLNNRLVFRNTGSYGKALLRYYCLAVPQLAASTLLVKQHAFIDLAAALVWGAVVYAIVYVIIGHKRDRKGLRCGAEEPEREAEHDYSPDAGI